MLWVDKKKFLHYINIRLRMSQNCLSEKTKIPNILYVQYREIYREDCNE